MSFHGIFDKHGCFELHIAPEKLHCPYVIHGIQPASQLFAGRSLLSGFARYGDNLNIGFLRNDKVN